MADHPIHFLREEILDYTSRLQTIVGQDEERMKTVIDLACENIIEHFNLEENYND